MVEQLEAEQSMFVQTARAITRDRTTLTLKDVSGPKETTTSTKTPNAVLAFLEAGDKAPDDAVVVLQQPRLEDGELSYSIETLEGMVPTQTGPVTLFIDPFGRPLSPVSVCGVRRRERRRDRRG